MSRDEGTQGRTRMWRFRGGVNRYINPIERGTAVVAPCPAHEPCKKETHDGRRPTFAQLFEQPPPSMLVNIIVTNPDG